MICWKLRTKGKYWRNTAGWLTILTRPLIWIVLFNRQVNEQTLIDQFDIPLQGDDFDDIREEYTQMLKKQAAKGNNGIIKSKYLIFGIESKGFKEARSKLTNIEADVIKNFTNLGTYAKSLDGKERLRILHEYFNQDYNGAFPFFI